MACRNKGDLLLPMVNVLKRPLLARSGPLEDPCGLLRAMSGSSQLIS